jgi:Protein of unknown function (DUF2946)
MVVRRTVYLAWLALALNVLAPVLGYAHLHVGPHGEIIDICAADEPGDTGAHHDHSRSDKQRVPHCPYCPGFAAGALLAYAGLKTVLHREVSAPLILSPYAMPSGRPSVRIARQRAPPTFS